jgi:DNA recombination-dependent growth factor C
VGFDRTLARLFKIRQNVSRSNTKQLYTTPSYTREKCTIMTIYQGNFAVTRYKIIGEHPKNNVNALSKWLEGHKLPPIKFDGPAQAEACGWVRPLIADRPEDVGEGHWDLADAVVGDDYLLRVRLDRRKIPSSLFQHVLKSELQEHLDETGKPMSRKERLALKQDLTQKMLKRCLPMIQYVDVLWRVEAMELHVFSASKSWCARVEQLFYQSFGEGLELSLMRIDHTTAFLQANAKSDKDMSRCVDRLGQLQPSVFATTVKSTSHAATM